jgi:hypothetical protein
MIVDNGRRVRVHRLREGIWEQVPQRWVVALPVNGTEGRAYVVTDHLESWAEAMAAANHLATHRHRVTNGPTP